ncbi:MAG: c-type cytochrome [Archangium sp.]|nr:c-type cytochrome [Archangium sp.]
MSARLFVVLTLAAPVAFANEAFFTSEVVDAVAVKQAPSGTEDVAWAAVKAKAFSLAPQRTIRLHDKQANAALSVPGIGEVQVKAAFAGAELTVLLEWSDSTLDAVRDDEVNTYADAAAVQVPLTFGKGVRLPAISMGDEEQPVRIVLQRATKTGALVSTLEAAGFGSSTRQAPAAAARQGSMTYDAKAQRWRAMFQLPVDAASALVPVAFALWEGGARLERAGNKRLSSWRFVRVPGRTPDPEYVKAMSWGFSPGELGDPLKGKLLAEAVCAACHHMPGRTIAAEGLAPNLIDVGAVATPGYLRESIINPNAVVLYGPNPNQHYDKSQPRDANGAYPNAEALRWFTRAADGKRLSKMPAFSGFSAEQIADLVAFLRSLDGKGPPP